MIRMTLSVTLPIITHIINTSILSGIFPEAWKLARVKPIPKNPRIEELKDLRPVSLLPLLSKVLERVVCGQLTKYLEQHEILPLTQSGFRRGHSTETALADVTDDIIAASDEGMGTALVLLDFSRAFDCINTDLMVEKLRYYGVSESSCRWFHNFLLNRRQYVETETDNGEVRKSSVKTLNRGTPQGSILSPILFILYTADLPNKLRNCKVHLYADDTQVYRCFKPAETESAIKEVNEDLNRIYEWSHKNSLLLNPSKSKFMILGTDTQRIKINAQNPVLIVQSQTVEKTESAKNLGLIIDSDLRYIEHINSKIRNAFYRLKVLYGIRKYLSVQIRKTLVDSLVLSGFNYCDTVYGPRLYEKTRKAIQRVQNACARFCFNIPRRAHVTPYLNENNILKMRSRRYVHLTCLVHKVVTKKRPRYLYNKLDWCSDIYKETRGMREIHKNLLNNPKHNSKGYRGCFKYSAYKVWNDLPPPMRKSSSQYSVKQFIKKQMQTRQKWEELCTDNEKLPKV